MDIRHEETTIPLHVDTSEIDAAKIKVDALNNAISATKKNLADLLPYPACHDGIEFADFTGELTSPSLPDDVRDILTAQLKRLDKLAEVVSKEAAVQQTNIAVTSQASITRAMCELARELRV